MFKIGKEAFTIYGNVGTVVAVDDKHVTVKCALFGNETVFEHSEVSHSRHIAWVRDRFI